MKSCEWCGKDTNNYKFCSYHCSNEAKKKSKLDEWLVHGLPVKYYIIKKHLAEVHGYKCSVCEISEWNSKPIVLELEHKDGNSQNNDISNVALICPNCHSQTETYKAKNKGNGRHVRRARYKDGKSF